MQRLLERQSSPKFMILSIYENTNIAALRASALGNTNCSAVYKLSGDNDRLLNLLVVFPEGRTNCFLIKSPMSAKAEMKTVWNSN